MSKAKRPEFAIQSYDEPMDPAMDVRRMEIIDPGTWLDTDLDLEPGTVYIRHVGPWQAITWGT
jgi:hypothetical protein